jgi:TorA maturation chaperone TorD
MQADHAQDIADESRAAVAVPLPLSNEDQARADLYALIARLLIAPPDESLLAGLAGADSLSSQQADHPLDLAWEKLVLTAAILDQHAIRDEFSELFVSIGTPPINPYASLYLSGFMNEKPLAALRMELAQLGLARAPGVGELEDHLAALCEIMRMLIAGGPGLARHSVRRQKLFYEKHIAPWVDRCLDDIGTAAGANFYRQVAEFARAFFAVESQAFDIEEACADAHL